MGLVHGDDIAMGYVALYEIKDHPRRYLVYRPAISTGIEMVVIFLWEVRERERERKRGEQRAGGGDGDDDEGGAGK